MILWGGGWLVMRVKRLDCRICQGPLGGWGKRESKEEQKDNKKDNHAKYLMESVLS